MLKLPISLFRCCNRCGRCVAFWLTPWGMTPMQKIFVAATLAAGLGLGGAASAADVYSAAGMKYVPVYAPSWAGLYLGFNAGYGVSTGSDQLAEAGYSAGLRPEGGFGGAQIGYNWQGTTGLVLGVEVDFQASTINDRNVLVYADSNEEYTSRLDWYGTVRGRIGYARGPALIYGTGGFAFGGLHTAYQYAGYDYRFEGTATGYVVGGGIEYQLTPAWSVKAEYQYLNFGKNAPCYEGYCWGTGDSTETLRTDDYHTFWVGLNLHLGGYEPLRYEPLK
jgi:outer membrane immunogenic protein